MRALCSNRIDRDQASARSRSVRCSRRCGRGTVNRVEYPTPALSNEISGRITPRDLGDPRLTRHFYTFTGLPGDLIITVESENLNGDIDLYIAAGLRPLTKVVLYAGSSATRASKNIFLRKQEPLVLRARHTPWR